MSKLNKALILEELKNRSERPKKKIFNIDEYCFDKQLAFIKHPAQFKTAVCSRRAGKCLVKGTQVLTPTGSRNIEDIKPGDYVYGFNLDGSISETTVLAVLDQGLQEVVDIKRGNRTLVTCTTGHPFVMETYKETTVKNLKEVTDFGRTFLKRVYVPISGGHRVVPQAYAIGALLGDGCSRDGGLVISGADEPIVRKVALQTKCTYKKTQSNNYNWYLKGTSKFEIPFYREWLHNKYAHEKKIDISEVRNWSRESQLELLAGLFDTDGSITFNNNRLEIKLGMQAEEVVKGAAALIEELFQVSIQYTIDKRNKYKNGPVHIIRVSTNEEARRVLLELSEYLQCTRKQWKSQYNSIYTQNAKLNSYGLKNISKPYQAQCYDLMVNNFTKLYVLTNGIVTHNTEACAADLLDTALKFPHVTCLYITLSRTSAERIIWRTLLKLLADFEIPHKVNNKELYIKLNNGSDIYVSGAKDKQEIEKFRGMSIKKAYVDECQSFKGYIKELIEDVLSWATKDVAGSICLIGTPGPVPAGYFYEQTHNPQNVNFKWTMADNPWIERKSGMKVVDILAHERARKGITESDPTYMREALGLWVKDNNALVYKFNPRINVFEHLPSEQMTYIFGIDIGYVDADAIAVMGYTHNSNNVYLVEEVVTRKQDITSLAKQIKELQQKYSPVKMVLDAGALGKKIQDEIRTRHMLPVEAAQKERKLEFIELLNDDLRTGRFKAFKNSVFQEDSEKIVWDYEGSIKKVSDRTHTDIGDSILYAWKECRHYFEIHKVPDKPHINSNAYMDQLEEKIAQKMQDEAEGNELEWGVDQDEFDSIYDVYGASEEF